MPPVRSPVARIAHDGDHRRPRRLTQFAVVVFLEVFEVRMKEQIVRRRQREAARCEIRLYQRPLRWHARIQHLLNFGASFPRLVA
jgi:predicted metal-dependent hydrolase